MQLILNKIKNQQQSIDVSMAQVHGNLSKGKEYTFAYSGNHADLPQLFNFCGFPPCSYMHTLCYREDHDCLLQLNAI